jgi:cytochrome c biogenesis protein CcdA
MYADKMLAGSVALIAAFWVAICAAAPEVIWQGLRIAVGHLTRADLLSALLLGLILAFFVEPLLRRTGDFFGPSRRASAEERRNPLFTAGLSLAFALVWSACSMRRAPLSRAALTPSASHRGLPLRSP